MTSILRASLLCSSLAIAGLQPAAVGAVWTGPRLISPGGMAREGRVGTGCPTFSWAADWQLAQAASQYELRIYAVGEGGDGDGESAPLRRIALPAGATAWTPELGDCLARGRYGWAVGAVLDDADPSAATRWSKPAVFQVAIAADPGAVHPPPGHSPTGAAQPAHHETARSASAPGVAGPRKLASPALYTPAACAVGDEMFDDVPADDPFCQWIEQLARDGLTSGCGVGIYCPDSPVTRRQLAVLIEKVMRGTLTWGPVPTGPTTTNVDDPNSFNQVGTYASIAIGVDGLPIVSYYDSTAQALKATHCDDLACARFPDAITLLDNPANNVGLYTSIAIGFDGLPIIAYQDATAGILKVAHCSDVRCTAATITPLDDPANSVGTFTSIAIGDQDHLAIIGYYDSTAGALKAAHCSNLPCTAATITTVDNSGADVVGTYGSIAIGADHLPIISYWNSTAGTLKVAHCNDAACAGANETITTVDDPAVNLVGAYSSIAIGADQLPIVAYQDATAGALKVAHCDDMLCAGANETITTVDDSPGLFTALTAIAIGADGLPVIAYRDLDIAAMKVAHCNDLACEGGDEILTKSRDHTFVSTQISMAIGIDGAPIIAYSDAHTDTLTVQHCENLTCAP